MDRKCVLSFRQRRESSEKKGNWCDAVSAALPGGQMMHVSVLPHCARHLVQSEKSPQRSAEILFSSRAISVVEG